MRNLPKLVWLLLVVLVPVAGALAWLVLGRPLPERPGSDRPLVAYPDDDEDFLRAVRARAEEQRRRAREQE